MKIGFVLDASLDGTDGIQQYILGLGAWLRDTGHDVHYLVGETTRSDVPKIHSLTHNLTVRFNGNRLSSPLPASSRKLRAVLSELNLDVLHVQVPYSPFMAGRLIQQASPTTAIVGTFHILPYSWLASLGSRFLRLLNGTSAGRFDAMIAVSEPAQKFARSHFGFHSKVIPNCFDYASFAQGQPATKSHKIVFLGRLVERKGALELIRAVALLYENGSFPADWGVVIGGKGDTKNELSRYIIEHGLESFVTLAGFIAEDAKADFLAGADIAVFPSTGGESFGISLIEAMAAARGVVLAGDNPGYRSVMEGFEEQLFDPKDTVTFSQLLLRWMQDTTGRNSLAKRQHDYATRYDVSIVAKQIVTVYQKALQKRHRS